VRKVGSVPSTAVVVGTTFFGSVIEFVSSGLVAAIADEFGVKAAFIGEVDFGSPGSGGKVQPVTAASASEVLLVDREIQQPDLWGRADSFEDRYPDRAGSALRRPLPLHRKGVC
jgi:hypothetical protein